MPYTNKKLQLLNMNLNNPNRTVPIQESAVERFLENCHTKRYASGSRIIHAGDPANTLYYITHGSVKIMLEDDTGHELVLAYLNKGDFFGEMGLFSEEERSALVIAKEQCDVAEIQYSKFRELVQTDPDILMHMASQLAKRLRDTSQKVIDLAYLDVTGRVAHTLLDLAKQPDALTHPDGMQIHITRQEIAKIVGCSREMAGRVLKELQQQGLITAHGKTIVVYGTR